MDEKPDGLDRVREWEQLRIARVAAVAELIESA
jgi:hypothetical protein